MHDRAELVYRLAIRPLRPLPWRSAISGTNEALIVRHRKYLPSLLREANALSADMMAWAAE
jgi:hypothetical protein